MGQGIQFLDLIFFAVIAVFLVLRLRNVLGRRTGKERRRPSFLDLKPTEESADLTGKVVNLPARGGRKATESALDEKTEAVPPAVSDDPVERGLAQIAAADDGFSGERFLTGARAAFEMVIGAFAAGDTETLRSLLNGEVYGNFAAATQARKTAGNLLETTLVGIAEAAIVEAGLDRRQARVTVKFVSDQINVTRDAAGAVVEGDPARVNRVVDLWTFARDTRSRDPNWMLVATRSPN